MAPGRQVLLSVCRETQEMKAFWVPSKAPDARQVLAKPDTATYCPASGKKLRLKDLIAVKFVRTPEEDSGVYMDPVTQDTFTNASSLVVLKPTGALFSHWWGRSCCTATCAFVTAAGIRAL